MLGRSLALSAIGRKGNGTPKTKVPYRFLPAALTAAWLLAFATSGAAHAHRLDAEAKLRPDHKVQVDAWFDLTGDPAQGAHVEVFGPADQLVAEGHMDERGVFVFTPPPTGEALRVKVSAGQGHVKELTLTPPTLEGTPSAGTEPLVRHSAELPIKDVLIGLGFLTAIAALGLSLRNARHLRELSRKTDKSV